MNHDRQVKILPIPDMEPTNNIYFNIIRDHIKHLNQSINIPEMQ